MSKYKWRHVFLVVQWLLIVGFAYGVFTDAAGFFTALAALTAAAFFFFIEVHVYVLEKISEKRKLRTG